MSLNHSIKNKICIIYYLMISFHFSILVYLPYIPRYIYTIFYSFIVQFLNKNMPHHLRNSVASSVTEQYLVPQGMPLKSPRQLKENLSATTQEKHLLVLNKTLIRKLNYLSFWSKYSWLEDNSQLHFKSTHSSELLTRIFAQGILTKKIVNLKF